MSNPCTFRLEGVRAASVALVGSFNAWSTTANLMRYSDGKWETEIAIPPGRHSYFFFALEKEETLRGRPLQMGSTIDVMPTRTIPES